MHFTYKICEVHKILSLTTIRIICDLNEMDFIYSVALFQQIDPDAFVRHEFLDLPP
jgi:hypothetical protein